VTADGEWKRLFSVRYRHLSGDSSFARWDWVNFRYRRPTADARAESCQVFEDSIAIESKLSSKKEQVRLLTPLIVGSARIATERGQSLALVRPRNPRFITKAKMKKELDEEREAYRRAAGQTSMFDRELAELEPSPYDSASSLTMTPGSTITRTVIGKRTPCSGTSASARAKQRR
jgi:hypothetical protein